MKCYYQQIEPFDRKASFVRMHTLSAGSHAWPNGAGRGRSLCLKSKGLMETPIPDARLYVELARCCHCYHSIYLFFPNVLQPCYQCYFCHFSCSSFSFFFFLGCICTNVIYTSNAPKLFCGCQQLNTLWCVCVREKQPNLCLMYINVALYGIYI